MCTMKVLKPIFFRVVLTAAFLSVFSQVTSATALWPWPETDEINHIDSLAHLVLVSCYGESEQARPWTLSAKEPLDPRPRGLANL